MDTTTTTASTETTSRTPAVIGNPEPDQESATARIRPPPALRSFDNGSRRSGVGLDDVLPTNVCDVSQLASLPVECISNNPRRPLRHVDEKGCESFYALQPLRFSVCMILVVELLERFSFYGIYYTLTLFLTGAYGSWNPGFTSVEAASLVSISTAMAYTTPFLGAYLADSVLGDFHAILIGSTCFYLPGVFLIFLTTILHLFGEEFHTTWLIVGLTILWPLGTGMVKSVVNVFGAKQFHPFLQSSLVESYYIGFYVAINVGALVGISGIPIVAQHNLTIAYAIPLMLLHIGVFTFVSGSSRYVIAKPAAHRSSRNKAIPNTDSVSLISIFRISLLIVPFAICYSQMPTTFILQGTVMKRAWWGLLDAATMNSADAASVLVFGYITSHWIYPELARRGIRIPTTYKFALGSFLAALALVWAKLIEFRIHSSFVRDGSAISILWQAPSYVLIGAGEIFAVSSAYEAAFNASPPQSKALSSAINIFCIGGIPNIICIALYHACRPWFVSRNSGTANLNHLRDYASANVGHYFTVLLSIIVFGILLNLNPRVRRFVESIEEEAAALTKTPVLSKSPTSRRMNSGEDSPLLRALLTESSTYRPQPNLNRMGSMRAGPSLGSKDAFDNATSSRMKRTKPIKARYIPRLYNTKSTAALIPRVVSSSAGVPIRVGACTPMEEQVKPQETRSPGAAGPTRRLDQSEEV